jgi:hypothetical protein
VLNCLDCLEHAVGAANPESPQLVLSHDARDRPHNRSYPHNIFYQGASETMNILRVFHWWIRTASKHIYRSAYLHQVQETRNLNLIVNGLIAGMMQVNARSRRKNCVLHTFRTSSSSRVILIGEVEVLEISGRSMAKSANSVPVGGTSLKSEVQTTLRGKFSNPRSGHVFHISSPTLHCCGLRWPSFSIHPVLQAGPVVVETLER